MVQCAIVYEDDNPVRLFRDENFLYRAYVWCHRKYCLDDEGLSIHQLPDYLKIKYFLLTEEEIERITK